MWHGSMRVREVAMEEARTACEQMAFRWLDETVLLRSLGVARDGHGRLRVRRIYEFRYLEAEHLIQHGLVMLLGDRVQAVLLDTTRNHA
ncbi:MAG: DUF3301 domain-containing protein [Magnetococcus sp. YQC-9]